MSDFDIENFPTSEAAKRMMSTISEGFYRDSYVMKWLQQVMGLEWDDAKRIIEEELPEQFYPETATWGLCYHEIKWGLPVRENLSYEERRRLIYQKRDYRAPMIPSTMEKYLEDVFGVSVYVSDIHDAGPYGYVPPHPNVFKVFFVGNETLDIKKVYSVIDKLKQSHTVYQVQDGLYIVVDNEALETFNIKNINFYVPLLFWDVRTYDGTFFYDGTFLYNAKVCYRLVLGLKYKQGEVYNQEETRLKLVKFLMYMRMQNDIAAGVLFQVTINFRSKLQDEYTKRMRIRLAAEGNRMNESIENVTVVTKRNLWFYNGAIRYDGSKTYGAIYKKEAME